VLDSERLLGTYTRYGKVVLLPEASQEPEQWFHFLECLGSRLASPGILFPTSDEHVVLLSSGAERLQQHFRFLIPDRATIERIVNKRSQYGIAEKVGIPTPRSYFPESAEDIRRLSEGLPYPCILKPYRSHLFTKKMAAKVFVVKSARELIEAYDRLSAMDVMIQEIVPGGDDALFGYLAFWDAEGAERAWVTKRKLRQYPPHFGDGSLQITVDAPEVAELSRRLLRTFCYRGLVGVEFKRDARDGTYRLMEINPRTVSGNQLAITAGIDFPAIVYEYLSGCRLGTDRTAAFRSGVKYVNEEWDLKAYLALRKTGRMGLGRWLRSLRGIQARAIGAWDDPLPAVIVLWQFLSAFRRRVGSTMSDLIRRQV
jgi:predicted ATP-grasp superfamily ATP-dependent carboligase